MDLAWASWMSLGNFLPPWALLTGITKKLGLRSLKDGRLWPSRPQEFRAGQGSGGMGWPEGRCGRKADPEPQERESPWVGKKLFGTSSRGLTRAHEPPSPRPPKKTLAVVLAATLVPGGCAGRVSAPHPRRDLCPAGFV